MKNIDPNFFKEVDELYKSHRRNPGQDDLTHAKKMQLWGRLCSAIGYLTAPLAINPIAIIGISLGKFVRWTMLAHHVTHRGYDRITGVTDEFHSATFARGWRRFLDWNDWIIPYAWDKEHNTYHHYSLGEPDDPDRVEKNLEWLRSSPLPIPLRYLVVVLLACTWKAIYYAPNTLLAIKIKEEKNPKKKAWLIKSPPWRSFMHVFPETMLKYWLPYIALNFLMIPFLFSLIKESYFWTVFWNILFAELLTNIHSFFVITPNHAGDDIAQFYGPIENKYDFYYRQVVGSVNYKTGGDLNDFFHGWLNYQIEHHVMPDLSMLQYQKVQPELQAICRKYEIPCLQHSVFYRIVKTMNVMVGKESNHYVLQEDH